MRPRPHTIFRSLTLPLLVPHNSCCRSRNVLYARTRLLSCHGGSGDEARLSWLSPTADWSRCVGGPRTCHNTALRGDLGACVCVWVHRYAILQTQLCHSATSAWFNSPHPHLAPCCEPISYLLSALDSCLVSAQAQQHNTHCCACSTRSSCFQPCIHDSGTRTPWWTTICS